MSPHIQCARSKKTKARTKPNILLPSLSPFISPHYHNPATVINTVRRHGDMLWSHKILIACPRAFDGGCQFRNGYLWSTKAPRGARHQPRCHRAHGQPPSSWSCIVLLFCCSTHRNFPSTSRLRSCLWRASYSSTGLPFMMCCFNFQEFTPQKVLSSVIVF